MGVVDVLWVVDICVGVVVFFEVCDMFCVVV